MPTELYIGPDHIKQALLAALLSVSLLVTLFAYLNRYTKRRYFNMWMTAWLFYAVWLMLTYRFEDEPSSFLMMAKTCSVGISALFLFWGGLIFMGQRTPQRLFGLLILFLCAWSYVSTYHLENPLQAKVPIFSMLGTSSIVAARCFFVYRMRKTFAGATLLCVGFALWGCFLISYPVLEGWPEITPTMFVLAALMQLFIAVSMIILVLEEVRTGRALAQHRMITERAARRGIESRFRQLFEQASSAIVITEAPSLKIMDLNRRAQCLLGLSEDSGPNVILSSFLERNVPACASDTQRLEKLLPGTPLTLVSRNGRRNAVTVERTNLEIEGQPAYQFVFKELTEKNHLEQQVRQAEKLSALGQMISGVAHELNNPLAVIKGHLDLMQNREDVPESLRADLRLVAQQSNRAAKLVRSFLSFAREQPAQRAAVDLNALIQSAVELRRFDSLVAQTQITAEPCQTLPLVTADPDQVQQVLINLVGNALDAIVSTGKPGTIRLRTDVFAKGVRVCVEDNGPGVPVELRTRIFEPFFTTKEIGAGTGLGLSIAHSIMAEHRGRIFCDSSALGGAAFTMEFPIEAIVERSLITPIPEPDFVPEKFGKILVLDDEEALADLVGQMLTLHGHDVIVTCTPLQALDRVRHEHFDVILSDYRMPQMDGRTFYAEVHKISPAKASRVIFLTGDVVSDETRTFFESIGNPRLTKPFQIDTVARAVNEMLLRPAA